MGVVVVYVKAAEGEPDELGDCPFAQGVMLMLQERKVPYKMRLVNLDRKSQDEDFLSKNKNGTVPVFNDGDDDVWISDYGEITKKIEEKYPTDPTMVTPPEYASVGSNIFSCFKAFLMSKDGSADGSEEKLLKELQALDDHLGKHGPFINGENVSDTDLSLAPKLYHLQVALGYFKKWKIPESMANVHAYTEELFGRESFKNTKPPKDKYIIRGWGKHMAN